MPPVSPAVDTLYGRNVNEIAREVSALQLDLAAAPRDADVAYALATRLVAAGQSDWALRVAGQVAEARESSRRWRAFLATSVVHAERIEMKRALEWAEKAYSACKEEESGCRLHEAARLETYIIALRAGIESGVDPKVDPRAFDKAVYRTIPTVYAGPPRED